MAKSLVVSESEAHANLQIAAGGAAGMTEALVCHPLGMSISSKPISISDTTFLQFRLTETDKV